MCRLLLFLYLLLFHFPSFSCSFNFLCNHDESTALLQFMSSFSIGYSRCGELHLKTTTWENGTDCCSWNGVACDTISGHVIGLNLYCEGIEGILHPNSTLFHLTHLQRLNLSYIDFLDSHFHFKFGRFQSLTHLDLSDCNFQGEIPLQISHLSKLESLHLSWNDELVWKETTLKRLVQNATNLRELVLSGTEMSSINPNYLFFMFNQSLSLVTLDLRGTRLSGKLKKSLLCLPNIQELDMSGNSLEGQLPELSCSTSLRILDLSECQFKGPIPLSFSNFTHLTSLNISRSHLNGSISSSLLTLPHLTSLDLSYNDLSGQIPTSLSNLQQLTELSLSHNSFSGKIPNVFSGMTKLKKIYLGLNKLEGQIPSSLITLTELVTLDCSHNKLEGPLLNQFSKFQKLTDMRLNDNLLNGTIPPSLLSLPSLENLYLTNNRFTGYISPISSYLLYGLYLGGNKLQGNIPESIFKLQNLADLDLSSNNLSGVINFQHFSNIENLASLSLSHNSQLSLNFESNGNYDISNLWSLDLSFMSLTEFPNPSRTFKFLAYLDLSNNKLSGRVPNWLFESRSLTFFNLSQNFLTSINLISRENDHLWGLDLSYNLLYGDLPASICNITSLQILNLAHNNLTGIIPQCLTSFMSLQVLDLQMNRFYGSLPSNFSKGYLRTLNLNDNQLEGHFPKSLSRCEGLEFLNLGSNKIQDDFPDWLQTLQYLKVLVLRDNKFHGIIANLEIKHSFPSLIIFDISSNNFSGKLPKVFLKKFEAMKNDVTESEYMMNNVRVPPDLLGRDSQFQPKPWYYDSMTMVTKGIKITLMKVPTVWVMIDLSRNKFEGDIPHVIGELHALIGLNISHNRLTGHIPQSMGNLTNLESLDLSSNMLTGVIPAELTNLNSLEVLDLSNNHLMGEIPQGKQFNTFSNDSYEGNLGLCGFPLSKKCGPEQHSPPSPNNFGSHDKFGFGFGWKPVAIGYGCGFVLGIGLGYFVFLIGSRGGW